MAVYPAVVEKPSPGHPAHGSAVSFALSVAFTLALSIGCNTELFSVVDQLLLRPLPYPEVVRLVHQAGPIRFLS